MIQKLAVPLSFRILAASVVIGTCAVIFSGCGRPETNGSNPSSATGSDAVTPGYTLVQELTSTTTDLIDNSGRLVHRWTSKYRLGGGAYILPNGNLVRTGILQNNPFNAAACPGLSGVAEILDWDSNQLWSFEFGTNNQSLHHDIAMLPNGNILMLGVEQKDREEQIKAGRDPSRMRNNIMWVDYAIEMKPSGKSGGAIVWEWHMWDHLIQDFDKSKQNYGVVSENPGKIDINFVEENILGRGNATLARLQSLGYVSSSSPEPANARSGLPDWTHTNSIAYNADLDQIAISVRGAGEFWILDHSTSKEEARTDKGGKQGKGGQLLYRWGNPQSYQRGAPQDQKLFGQHDVHWVAKDRPGAGNILLFNNGDNRKAGPYSTIEEIKTPVKPDGSYEMEEGTAFGPAKAVWQHAENPKESFYSQFLSGVDRQPNGNTLVCSGVEGRLFEVTPAGKTIWSKKSSDFPPSASRRAGRTGPSRTVPANDPGGVLPSPTTDTQPKLQRKPSGTHDLTTAEIAFLMAGSTFGPPMPRFADGPPGFRPNGMPGSGPAGARSQGPNSVPTRGIFRATKYALDSAAFKGRKLDPITLP